MDMRPVEWPEELDGEPMRDPAVAMVNISTETERELIEAQSK